MKRPHILTALQSFLNMILTSKNVSHPAKNENIPISGKNIGPITKTDIIKAARMNDKENIYAVILAYNYVNIFTNTNIRFTLLSNYCNYLIYIILYILK